MKNVAPSAAPPQPLERLHFEAAQLMNAHPPTVRVRNKKVVFAIACPAGSEHRGRIQYSRWPAMSLSPHSDVDVARNRIVGRPGFYDYAPELDLAGAVEWHVNFADPHLFGAYASELFAQDEMQVAEHPALGALREALLEQGAPTVTEEYGKPTPVLVMGVERRCRVATEPNASENRPRGLYGNQFDYAPVDSIQRATQPIDPPTITNLIAMAAPRGGRGAYTVSDILYVLITAYTGFRAAIFESASTGDSDRPVIVHTGFWGCGAFGGNHVLMAMLQAMAAGMAGLERLVFHTGADGAFALATALDTLEALAAGAPGSLLERIEHIESLGFEWGEGNGT